MIPVNFKITYQGKDITELSREELLRCIEWCMTEIERMKKSHFSDIELHKAFAKAGLK